MLATIETVDFLYTCPGHLSDSGFASTLGGVDGAGSRRKMELTEEEIAKVKQEWEEKQKKKLEREKEKEKERKEKEKPDKDKKDEDAAKDKPNKKEEFESPKLPSSPSTPVPPTPSHERYALHRDYFASELLVDFSVPIAKLTISISATL